MTQKFLIIKTSSLGDILQAFPAANYLRQKFPAAIIDWVVESSFIELVKANPDINQVFAVNTKQWRKNLWSRQTWRDIQKVKKKIQQNEYEAIFDLQGNIKSGLITYVSLGKTKVGFNWKSVPEKPNLWFTNQKFDPEPGKNIRTDYLAVIKKYFNDSLPFSPTNTKLKLSSEQNEIFHQIKQKLYLSINKFTIMVCPGSAWKNKQVSKDVLIDFLNRLHNQVSSFFILAWGSQDEYEFVKLIHEKFLLNSIILARVSLPVLQNIMDEMHLIIAMDSLPLHLAGTTRAATFSVFGPSLAEKYKPEGTQHVALQGQCPYGRQFPKRCPILRTCPTGACIHSFKGEELFDFVTKEFKDICARGQNTPRNLRDVFK